MTLYRAIGVRVAVLAVLLLVVLFFLGDFRRFLPWRLASESTSFEVQPVEVAELSEPAWPHRRGPYYDALSDETALADGWPTEGPPVLWIREIGRGYSGFVAVGDRVYTQVQSVSTQSVVCLEADTGRLTWQYDYAWPYEAVGMYPGPRATPTWHAGRIYFAGPRGVVGCLRAEDGRLLWSVDVNEKFDGRGTDFGYANSPLVEDGKVILPVGGPGASVVALDARDGSTVWTSGDEPASYCSAIPITFGGRRCAVAFLQNALALFDLRTGRLLCQEKFSAGYDEHAAAPLYDEPYLMIARPFQSGAEAYRLELDEDGAGLSLVSAWYNPKLSNDTASSVAVDGHVYGFDLRDVQAKAHRPSRGEFRCLHFKTGETVWSSKRTGHATVIAAGGKLFLFNDRGEALLVRASSTRYEELGRAKVFSGEICWTAPALHRGRLYLRSPRRAACLYVGRPEQLGEEQPLVARSTSELPKSRGFDWTWFVGGEREYAFDPADAGELARWYAFSLLGVLGPAALLGAVVHLGLYFTWPKPACRAGRVVFWSTAFLLAVAGTPLYNRLGEAFIFTWPVCLFVAHQLVLLAIVRSRQQASSAGGNGVSLLATVFFVAVCLAYFLVCRRLSLAIEWIFLLGFLPSWPIAVPAAYKLQRSGHPVWDLLWAMLSFSAYFWAAGGFILWKMATL